MTCRGIDDLMSPQSPTPTPEIMEHLRKCGICRALVLAMDEGGKPVPPLETSLKRIEARIVENLKPVRPLASARLFLAVYAIIFLFVVGIGAMPSGMNGWRALNLVQRTGIFVTLTTSAMLLAVSMVAQIVPGSKYAFAPESLPIIIFTALLVVLSLAFRPREEPAFVANGLVCLKNGFTCSFRAGVLFWLVVRRGAMLDPKLIGVVAGALAGLTGLTVLEINCANLNVFHILAWHWGVVLISSGAGALLGAAIEHLERWRRRRAS